jgi:ribosomal protein L7/L12
MRFLCWEITIKRISSFDEQIKTIIIEHRGGEIDAVKFYRSKTDATLREAKEYCDKIRETTEFAYRNNKQT